MDKPGLVIGAEGSKVIISYWDDSGTHDSPYYTYTVTFLFADPALNPPNEEPWQAGQFVCHYREFTAEKVMEVARAFYDFLMGFRTAYGKEDAINDWRRKYETAIDNSQLDLRIIQDLKETLRWREARIKELETDYIKKLEMELRSYKTVVECARDRALQDAELLTIKDGE